MLCQASEECSSTVAYLKHFASEIAHGLWALAQRQCASGWWGQTRRDWWKTTWYCRCCCESFCMHNAVSVKTLILWHQMWLERMLFFTTDVAKQNPNLLIAKRREPSAKLSSARGRQKVLLHSKRGWSVGRSDPRYPIAITGLHPYK